MLRLFKCLPGPAFVALAFVTVAAAQTQQPTPATEPAPAAQQSPQSGVATLRAGTQLVVVDVVVTDKNQRPVHGLKASEFTLTDSAVTTDARSPLETMRIAMMRGSPTPTEIIMKVAVFPVGPSTQTEDNPAPRNILSEKVHGPFRRYSVSYAIVPSDITFLRAPDGKIHAAFELVIFVFNPAGILVNRLSNVLHIASPLDELKKNVANGIQYRQEISAPANGEYFLRIVVHDLTRDRLGAVEVATSEVKNLQPPTAPPPPPTPSTSPAAEPANAPAIPR